MHCIYINLDQQIERRNFVEDNFSHHVPANWALHRFTAIDSKYLPEGLLGKLRDTEKACFLSHIGALEMAMTFAGDVLILEDDVWFGPSSIGLIDMARQSLGENEWDLLFTDLCIVNPRDMLDLFQLRKEWDNSKQVRLLDLSKTMFAGATAYIVRQESKSKLLQALKRLTRLDAPYDLVLRHWIQQQQLTARGIFPFATSLSLYAESSQVQLKETEVTDACWNAFRRLVCVDANDLELTVPALSATFGQDYRHKSTEVFANILALRLSPKFPIK